MRPDDDLSGLRPTCQVHRPGDTGYQRARRPVLGAGEEVLPRAVIACAAEDDVVRALAYARDRRVAFTLRGGGLLPYSTSDGLVIDMSGVDSIAVGDGAVEVGAGVRVGALADRLAADGLVVPVGRCRVAGVVGSVLGGGHGLLGRYYGLGSDHLLSARVLLADGRIVRASADEHPDLFWALRGAGACAFGAVLSVRLRTRPAVRATAVEVRWESDYAAAVIEAWQHIAPAADRTVDLGLSVVAGADDEPSGGAASGVVARGVIVGTPADAEDVLSGFTARAGVPVLPALAELAPGRCAHPGGHPGPGVPDGERPEAHPVKAEFFAAPLPAMACTALADHLARAGERGISRELEFLPWGGALAEGPGTAFGHRSPAFLLTHGARVGGGAVPRLRATAGSWVARSWGIAHPHGTGRAPQYHPDPELSAAAYFGRSLLRLRAIKHHYDPAGVFVPPLW